MIKYAMFALPMMAVACAGAPVNAQDVSCVSIEVHDSVIKQIGAKMLFIGQVEEMGAMMTIYQLKNGEFMSFMESDDTGIACVLAIGTNPIVMSQVPNV